MLAHARCVLAGTDLVGSEPEFETGCPLDIFVAVALVFEVASAFGQERQTVRHSILEAERHRYDV